ncbi:MAG: His-Xaa-Ser system radical SAM maturase HxsB [Proteobacteria bacterium]|nr:His-Xaa-Ser system radical SAM maturase HxsB [Pseudomonadota bacterium]
MKTIELPRKSLTAETLGFFRFGEISPGRWVITNDAGEWEILSTAEFDALLAGTIETRESLTHKGFLRTGSDLDALAERVRRKKHFVGKGPHLHMVVTTLRCNQDCRYCHASRTNLDQVQTDMSLETAKKVVDLAMQSTSPYLCFEYQGGEPTVNFEAIKFIVEYSREKNRYEGKTIDHSLVTNFTWMDEEKAEWLIANDVLVCTSLDGPEELHNWNRTWRKGSNAFEQVMRWIAWFNARYIELGRDPKLWHIDALLTTTRRTLSQYREVVDLYVSLGIRNVHLRPLNPFGFATRTWKNIGYTTAEYLAFYEQALDYILELNLQGEEIMEGTAALFLKKMLTPDDPNFVDIRSPIGAGTGGVAYNYDGAVVTSDEGRMVLAMGDPLFKLGDAASLTYPEMVGHPTVKALAVASYLDSLPGCSTCFNAPWCGVRPLHNYMHTGDVFGQRPNTAKCAEHMTIARLLLNKLDDDPDGDVRRIFDRWTVDRPRQ